MDSPRSSNPSANQAVLVACCNIIENDGSYLLVKESKPAARSRYNLPAGKAEVGESFMDAAVREAEEETGLVVKVDHLVGIYHCARTSEGFGVVNFVFSSHVVGGTIRVSEAHPVVQYFTKADIADMARDSLLRGSYIELALNHHVQRRHLPNDTLQNVPPSPFPREDGTTGA